MERLHNRKQNEATEYGSAFARAMELVLGDARYVFVSGTASIDDHGATVHVGDFETQTRYTLEAVEALLDGRGRAPRATSARRRPSSQNPCDGRAFERIVERSGAEGAPLVTTVADVCRDDLLFEIDAVAVVPLGPRGAAVTAAPLAPALAVLLRRAASARRRRREPGARRPSRRWSWRRSRSRASRRGARRRNAPGGLGRGRPPRPRAAEREAPRAHRLLPQRRRPGGVVRREVHPVRGEEGGIGPVVRLRDEGGRHARRGRSPAARPARASRSTSPRSTRSRRRTSSPGCRSPSSARTPASGTRPGSRRTRACGRARRTAPRCGGSPSTCRTTGTRRSCRTAGWSTPAGCGRRGGSRRIAWRSSASTRTAPTTRPTPGTRACA